MRLFKTILYALLDSCFAWFIPKWRQEGRAAAKAASRYLNYFGEKLEEERRREIARLRDEVKEALFSWDKEAVKTGANLVQKELSHHVGGLRPGWVETVESIFVILVVFLGIRTYFVQPFRIPTGSMQPSLNGIVIHPVDELPGMLTRMRDAVLLGSSYVDEKADRHKSIVGYRQGQKWLLFTETVVQFDDGSSLSIPCAAGAVGEYFKAHGGRDRRGLITFEPGETIIKARIDAGDMILVNRMAYHFRRPVRGEAFVFDTRGIDVAGSQGGALRAADQSKGTHYIKRLCGLPGDTVEIREPDLIVNGRVADDWRIRRVAGRQAPYNSTGYNAILQAEHPFGFITDRRGIALSNDKRDTKMREYAALGDNTVNSLDSRYWGPVRQFNVIGPAGFALWPFTFHWGLIP
ncbi:MAG: signal peptidase I [Akkermansiaceae bacterium]|nr:signal peptidase I [Akkermansiaceae bacterium]